MYKPIGYGSSSSGGGRGNINPGVTKLNKEQPETVSITIDDGYQPEDASSFKVLHQIEPPEAVDAVNGIIANHKFYDLVLAWNPKVLEACPNAVLFPWSICTWIDYWSTAYVTPVDNVKEFKASFLTTNKAFMPGHLLRQEIYDKLPGAVGLIRIDKWRSPAFSGCPTWMPDKRTVLDSYQFTITPQNAYHRNWFDDKLMDALVAKTIPLYWGCPNLGDFFNTDGIIPFNSYDELVQKLSALTPEYYTQHLYAVEDNYQRAMNLVHVWDRMDTIISNRLEKRRTQ